MAIKEQTYEGRKLYTCTLCPLHDSFDKAEAEAHQVEAHPDSKAAKEASK